MFDTGFKPGLISNRERDTASGLFRNTWQVCFSVFRADIVEIILGQL